MITFFLWIFKVSYLLAFDGDQVTIIFLNTVAFFWAIFWDVLLSYWIQFLFGFLILLAFCKRLLRIYPRITVLRIIIFLSINFSRMIWINNKAIGALWPCKAVQFQCRARTIYKITLKSTPLVMATNNLQYAYKNKEQFIWFYFCFFLLQFSGRHSKIVSKQCLLKN